MELGLKGAKVLVIASSDGLGAATARQFSLEGAIVVINSRNLEKLQDTAAKISEESGNPVFTQAGDISNPEIAKRVVTRAYESLHGLDILVTNAGGPPSGSFNDFDLNDWQSATNLTFLSTVNLIQSALPYLRQSKRASILTITSISVKEPVDNLILSNSIRPAVMGLTKSLSRELGPAGIRVNSILPGMTDTERIRYLFEARATKNKTSVEEEKNNSSANIPLQRIGTPQEFANAAVFLCSPAAGYITGVALPVDGGAIRATL